MAGLALALGLVGGAVVVHGRGRARTDHPGRVLLAPRTRAVGLDAVRPRNLTQRSANVTIGYRTVLSVEATRPDGAPMLAIELRGELAVVAAERDEAGRERVRCGFTGEARAGARTLPMPGLAEPFDAYFGATGELVGVAWADAVSPTTRNLLATLAIQLQIATGPRAVWEATERDTLGAYRSRYVRSDAGLAREKLAYTTLADRALVADVVGSMARIELSPDGWPAVLAGEETLRVGMKGAEVGVTTRIDLVRTRSSEEPAPPSLAWAIVALESAVRVAEAERTDDLELVDGASLSDLLAERAAIVDDHHAAGYQYLRIAALLRVEPARALEAARRLRETTSDDEVRVLAGALGDAGTPEAQVALGEIAAATEVEAGRRAQAVVSLGLTRTPTREAIARLRSVAHGPAGDLADAAWLALGNAALRIRPHDPVMAASIVDEILGELGVAARTGDEPHAVTLIRAGGNAGDARIVSALTPLAIAPSAALRAVVLSSLRLIDDPVSHRVLAGGLLDAVAEVREAAAYAIGFQPPAGFIDAILAAYRREPSVDVRRELLVTAATSADEVPAFHALLERAAASDPDAGLRELAARALSGA